MSSHQDKTEFFISLTNTVLLDVERLRRQKRMSPAQLIREGNIFM
ncbi:unnamed protein product, partial [Gulo gulo]